MKARRMVIVTIDSLLNMLKDYMATEDLPATAKAVKMMYRPTDKGRIGIMVEDDGWVGMQRPLEAKFDLRRVWTAN